MVDKGKLEVKGDAASDTGTVSSYTPASLIFLKIHFPRLFANSLPMLVPNVFQAAFFGFLQKNAYDVDAFV
jgi:hypothetical protein